MQEKSIVKLGFLYTVHVYIFLFLSNYLPKANTTLKYLYPYIYWSQRPPTPKPTRLPAEKHRYCEEVVFVESPRMRARRKKVINY